MTLPVPLRIEGESTAAYSAFCKYAAAGNKRSIRQCARRLRKSDTIIARWSRKHHWQKRLMELQTEAALQSNEAAREASAKAEQRFADELAQARTRWIQSQIKVAERMTQTALQMLEQPMKGNRPDDSAKLFSAANAIASTALGLDQQHGLLPMQPIAPPIIHLTVHRDGTSDYVERQQYEFALAHPDHPQSERWIRQYEADRRERRLPYDWPKEMPQPPAFNGS